MIDTQIIVVPNPSHPYGVRGVRETQIVASQAVVSNAVRDHLGFRIDDVPLSPPSVLEAINERGGGGGGGGNGAWGSARRDTRGGARV